MNTSRMMSLVTSIALASLLAGCGCGDGSGLDASLSSKVQNVALSSAQVCRGSVVAVQFTDTALPGQATIEVCADRDGNLATTDDQFTIVAALPAQGGGQHEVHWDTSGVPADTYYIVTRTTEGGHSVVEIGGTVAVVNAAVPAFSDGGSGRDWVNTVNVRSDCGFYAMGTFGAPGGIVDEGGLSETSLASTANGAYFARYARNGSVLWIGDVRVADGASGGASAGASATHPDGGVVMTGAYTGSPTITDGLGDQVTLPSSSVQSLWIARFSEQGSLRWVQTLRDQVSHAWSIGIDVATDGSIAYCGAFRDGATFGAANDPAARTIVAAGTHGFVSRWNDDGTLRWVRTQRTPANQSAFNFARRVMHATDGSLLVVGRYAGGTLAVEGGAATLPAPVGARDSFLLRYAADGSLSMLAPVASGAGGYCEAVTLAPLPLGAFAISGHFQTQMTLGAGTTGVVVHTTNGNTDGFVARYAADGTPSWSRVFGGDDTVAGDTDGSAIASTPDGEIIVTGKFVGTASFGLDTAGNPVTFTSQDDADSFALRLRSDGSLRWMRVDGGVGYDHTCDVKVCPDGCIVAAGWFFGDLHMDAGGLGDRALTSRGSSDGLLYVLNGDGGF